MIAVIFEVEPHPERKDAYLEAAARLKPLLEGIDGFISVDRFQSLSQPGRIHVCPATRNALGRGRCR